MESQIKKIAAIFEEQKVFLTFGGDCYRYSQENGAWHCQKMNKLAQKTFWADYRQKSVAKQQEMVNWQPVVLKANDLMPVLVLPYEFQSLQQKLSSSEIVLKIQEIKWQKSFDD